MSSSRSRSIEQPEELLATCPTPNGNLFQLTEIGGRYELVTFTRQSSCVLTEEAARAWYKTTRQCGGKLHRRFPVVTP